MIGVCRASSSRKQSWPYGASITWNSTGLSSASRASWISFDASGGYNQSELNAISSVRALTPASARASEPPVRLSVLFAGNGFHSKEWWAKGEGKDLTLGKVLLPLDPFREKLLFIPGLHNEQAKKGNIHSSQTVNLLSGAPLASGNAIR